jgi:hypothetical protein
MKLAVLRPIEAGWLARVTTNPLNDINANRIVHPSIFTLLALSPVLRFVERLEPAGKNKTNGALFPP